MNTIQLSQKILQAGVPTVAIEKLTERQHEIVKATHGTRIGQMTNAEVTKLAGEVIFTAKMRLGYSQSQGDELKAEIRLIINDLREYQGLTPTEIHLALKAGLNGEFSTDGKVFFSSSNFVQWLRRWIADKKQPVMKQYTALEQAKENVKIPPTEAEEKELCRQVAQQYGDLKRTHPDFEVQVASSLYDDLERFGIWKMEVNEKKELFEKLQRKYTNATHLELVLMAKNIAYNRFIAEVAKGILMA